MLNLEASEADSPSHEHRQVVLQPEPFVLRVRVETALVVREQIGGQVAGRFQGCPATLTFHQFSYPEGCL